MIVSTSGILIIDFMDEISGDELETHFHISGPKLLNG